ncbi:MAG: HDIG domain-containing metalloprotein [Pirellulales bacterium]
MPNGIQKRTRQQRVASVELPPGVWGTLTSNLQRGHVLLRLALCALVALILWGFTTGWDPPFGYQTGQIPTRNVIARIDFDQPDLEATEDARKQARKLALAVYDQDPEPLIQLRAQLRSEIGKMLTAEKFEQVDTELWNAFQTPLDTDSPDLTVEERHAQFQQFREAFAEDNALDEFNFTIEEIMIPLEQWGLLEDLPTEPGVNYLKIFVRSMEGEGFGVKRDVESVRIKDVTTHLQQSLIDKLSSTELARRIHAWFQPRLMPTLTLDIEATRKAQDAAAAAVAQQTKLFFAGKDVLALAGEPLKPESIELLRLENDQLIAERTLVDRLWRTLAIMGMYTAFFTLCGFYIHYQEPAILDDLRRFFTLLSLVVVTVVLALIAARYSWGADCIPLLLFGMTMAIAYHQELALLLSASVTLIVVISMGHGLDQALVLMAPLAGAILVLRQVRTRGKLLAVGFVAACVALLTALGVGTLYGQPIALLVEHGFLIMSWSVIAGSLMTVLLPVVEKVFSVQTDLSLIELGDPAHPLLQELIRRAPGTYNHSITVASLAEAAAESIGARGLLVRVGAYFHDIGKMLKPGYFIENQGHGNNRHDSLVPAMSTLVIIAHVKDGADLGRQNKLPESIIDFIQQHHGTTLVEYFYRQANVQKEQNPDNSDVDESSFRYPGPKPQTKEAGVLMLSDAVESVSRVLKEPTPSRIENLVEELSMKRLLDGQLDECGLTLEEVRKIGESLVKSLTAVYHGRVKYPDQETA